MADNDPTHPNADTTVFPTVDSYPDYAQGAAAPQGAMPPQAPMQGGYPTQGYPAQGYPQMMPGMMPPQPPKKSNGALIGVLVTVAVLALVGAIVYFGDAFGLRTKLTGSSDVVTSTVVVDDALPNNQAPAVQAPAAIQPQAGWSRCGGSAGWAVYAGSSVTSCPFALNVYNSLGGSFGTRTVTVYSPVTGQNYAMRCVNNGGWYTCTGGNNAVVQIIPE
ncbi:hypothetical protein C1Y63_01265 [Corynebacterium sp. 13CS0277]|uniref:hypothetical protein n=1 Tax=Corynebacterium sp. 13CS0277 TaxID=2071994 RepID=UPI000D026D83|nr:hypothetical protein [Corynebacterium sp. 13CS0277]PRQ12450.1 hypothetical protein C1Y63_01265 [Corynebacterium sp. 13CS0277]